MAMVTELDVDPALFRVWGFDDAYDGAADDGGLAAALAADIILDLKSESRTSPLEELQDMLNGMTRELRAQLQQFQALKRGREADDGTGEPADRKQIQADAKASIEAMSVIVRTLEKIDALQRTIDRDRREKADDAMGDEDYAALVARFEERIEARAQERAAGRIEETDAGSRQPEPRRPEHQPP